jgi:hypothetical protein
MHLTRARADRGSFLGDRGSMKILPILVAVAVTAANAQGNAVREYEGGVAYGMTDCRLTFQMSESLAEAQRLGRRVSDEDAKQGDFQGCIDREKAAAKKRYGDAVETLSKASAKAALKEHLIAVMNYLDGINPGASEPRMLYVRRQTENSARVKEMWTRFEVER